MALSVKHLDHLIDCPPPDNQINAYYHPTSAVEVCDGNGVLTAIFSYDFASIEAIVDDGGGGLAGDGGICSEGMDVVFLIDYTGSMSGAIEGVKTGVASLISTIDTQSGGNYRLGLVTFDGGSATPSYANSGYYQGLPAAQKINTTHPEYQSGNTNIQITCQEKMTTVGNSASFTNIALAALNQPNSSTGMALGSSAECGGIASYEIASNGFAGSWRTGVQKLIIVITDIYPEASMSWFQNTLTPALSNNDVQVMINKSGVASTRYSYIADNTIPAGATHYGLNFNSTWTTGLEASIIELCDETFTYTCEPLAAGWYQEVGSNVVNYWDGTAWTNTHDCVYTVRVNLSESISNATLNDIPTAAAHYVDADTFEFTGVPGTSFTFTGSMSADTNYSFTNITDSTTSDVSGLTATSNSISTWTDGGEGNPQQDAVLTTTQFKIQGVIQGHGEYNISFAGTTTSVQYKMVITVVSTIPTSDTPPGGLALAGIMPIGATWSDVSSNYSTYYEAINYSIDGPAGSQHVFNTNHVVAPSDYTVASLVVTGAYSNTPTQNTFQGNHTLTSSNLSSTFIMPSGGGEAEFYLDATITQPEYTLELTATENITGAYISTIDGIGTSETYTGYTGETSSYLIQMLANATYNAPNITGANITGDTAVDSYNINNTNDTVSGTVTMPDGGGAANIEVLGTNAGQTQHSFVVTINDNFGDVSHYSHGSYTFTGYEGQNMSANIPLSGQVAEYSYTVSGVSDNSLILTSANTGTTLNLSLTMPDGGGTATVTVTGDRTIIYYDYTVVWKVPAIRGNYGWGPSGGIPNQTSTGVNTVVSAPAGEVLTVYPPKRMVTDHDFYFSAVTASENGAVTDFPWNTRILTTTGDNSLYTEARPQVILTMPSGGGSSIVDVSGTTYDANYIFTIDASSDSPNSSIGAHDCVDASEPFGLSRGTVLAAGNVILTFNGNVGNTFNAVILPVRANNYTDYDSEIINWSTTPDYDSFVSGTELNTYCGANIEVLDFDFTMPSLDPRVRSTNRTDLVINDTVSAISHIFVLTSGDSIPQVSANNPTQYFSGAVGSSQNWTSVYSATSGWTFNISSVLKSGTNSSDITVSDSTGTGIGGTLTMPSGGGSGTVTAKGTSTQTAYDFTVNFVENIANATWANGLSTDSATYSLVPGASAAFNKVLTPVAGYEFTSGSITYSDDSGDVVGSATWYSGNVSVTISMPSNATSAQSATVTMSGTTVLIQRQLQITYSESIVGAYISSGYGAGAAVSTSASFSGVPGATGSHYRYLTADVNGGYLDADITNLTTDNANTVQNLAISTKVSTGRKFTYDYTIPAINSTNIITINGFSEIDCSCNFLGMATQPTSSTSNNGNITINVSDACIPQLTWTVNGFPLTPNPTANLFEYEFTGLDEGTYIIEVTDGNGCTYSWTWVLAAPETTTAAPSYYYYSMIPCDDADCGPYIVRSTSTMIRMNFYEISPAIGVPEVLMMSRAVDQQIYDATSNGVQTFDCPVSDCAPGGGGFI